MHSYLALMVEWPWLQMSAPCWLWQTLLWSHLLFAVENCSRMFHLYVLVSTVYLFKKKASLGYHHFYQLSCEKTWQCSSSLIMFSGRHFSFVCLCLGVVWLLFAWSCWAHSAIGTTSKSASFTMLRCMLPYPSGKVAKCPLISEAFVLAVPVVPAPTKTPEGRTRKWKRWIVLEGAYNVAHELFRGQWLQPGNSPGWSGRTFCSTSEDEVFDDLHYNAIHNRFLCLRERVPFHSSYY